MNSTSDLSQRRLLTGDILALLLVLAVAVFYIATIRTGHPWGDDFALFIGHARNIAEGRDYANTGFIYNPAISVLSPRTYPPVFPLLLAPVYAVYGLNLSAMKVENILFFAVALVLIYYSFKPVLSVGYGLALIVLVGFNPYIWNLKDNILSEFSFLMFQFLCLLQIDRAYASPSHHSRGNRQVFLIGLSMYLVYGTRSAGLVLLPSFLLYDWIRLKRPSAFAVKTAALFLVCAALQRFVVTGESGYLDQVTDHPLGLIQNINLYYRDLVDLWFEGYPTRMGGMGLIGFFALLLIGFITRLRTQITIWEIFPLPYLILIMSVPWHQGSRYLLPVIPIFIFHAFYGLQVLGRAGFSRIVRYTGIFGVATVLISYSLQVPKMDYPTLNDGIGRPEAVDLLAKIRALTAPGDVLITGKPRAFALLTARRAASYHMTGGDTQLWDYFHSIEAKYIIVSKTAFYRDVDFLHPFIARNHSKLDSVYANSEFTLYRIIW